MRSLSEFLGSTFITADDIKKEISEECKKVPVYNKKYTQEDTTEKVSKYIFPQLMKSEVISYISQNTGSFSCEIETKLATIFIKNEKTKIIWNTETVSMIKNYLNKKENE